MDNGWWRKNQSGGVVMKKLIGFYIEKEPRKITAHTSYAADWIEHETIPGKYPVYLVDNYWLCFGIKSNIIASQYFNGFGGVNYSSVKNSDLGPSVYTVQMYAYYKDNLINKGLLELCEEEVAA